MRASPSEDNQEDNLHFNVHIEIDEQGFHLWGTKENLISDVTSYALWIFQTPKKFVREKGVPATAVSLS